MFNKLVCAIIMVMTMTFHLLIPIKSGLVKRNVNCFINQKPERDNMDYRRKNVVVPGNAEYGKKSSNDKNVCILSDNICKRKKIHEFNKYIRNKKAYKKCYPGMGNIMPRIPFKMINRISLLLMLVLIT